jgi:hypothetical protein
VIANLSSNSKEPSCGIDPNGQPYGFTGFAKERDRSQALAVVGQACIVHSSNTAGDVVKFNCAQAGLIWAERSVSKAPT